MLDGVKELIQKGEIDTKKEKGKEYGSRKLKVYLPPSLGSRLLEG